MLIRILVRAYCPRENSPLTTYRLRLNQEHVPYGGNTCTKIFFSPF